MPAHLRPHPACDVSGCQRRSTHTLYDTWNTRHGSYCDQHKDVPLLNLLETERKKLDKSP